MPGDEIFTSRGGWVKVGSASWTAQVQTVYNLEVGGFHAYFVGDVGAWVHNGCGDSEETWGKLRTLTRHFLKHGEDFGAESEEEYAQMASDFLQRSQADNLPTKIDGDGVIRVFDPETETFGSYNADGTTRTFFKPNSPTTYWSNQPGDGPWTP